MLSPMAGGDYSCDYWILAVGAQNEIFARKNVDHVSVGQ